jgi:hypothetical protein
MDKFLLSILAIKTSKSFLYFKTQIFKLKFEVAELITQIKKTIFSCLIVINIIKNINLIVVKVTSCSMIENEIGYRGSKSDVSFQLPQPNMKWLSVKEQRVDGSYFGVGGNTSKLRCILMGRESGYQFKILSKQHIKRFYSSLSANNSLTNLNPWFITGFTDAEGCFTIKVQPNANLKTKWRIRPVFSITLNSKDLNLLESIKFSIGAGTISQSGKTAIYAVESIKDLPLIISHFDKYPLITQKVSDYLIFKQCCELIIKNEHLTETGLLKILGLKSSLNLGLPDSLKLAFPNVLQKDRPEYFFNGIPDPFWVSGFTSGDGSFHIVDVKNKGATTGVLARFSVHLHVRDLEVLKGLSTYSKSLNFDPNGAPVNTEEKNKNIIISENSANLQISKFSDVTNILIPFFNKYPILGVKSLDFEDFKKICDLMQTKKSLNSASCSTNTLDKILEIKSNMNLRRKIK